MKISDEILGILSRCTVDGNTLYLPDEQLDRKTYTAVNKCLVNIGGKWCIYRAELATCTGKTCHLAGEFPPPRRRGLPVQKRDHIL